MRRHIKFGTLDSEWFQLSIDEARTDPIGFWEIVKTGRQGFGLDGDDLEAFVFDYVLAMLKGGANPVLGDRSRSSGWRPVSHYGAGAETAACAIVAEWKAALKAPDESSIWFAFPYVWE
jgi:hypothetical protein